MKKSINCHAQIENNTQHAHIRRLDSNHLNGKLCINIKKNNQKHHKRTIRLHKKKNIQSKNPMSIATAQLNARG